MGLLRMVAILSNIAFLVYAALQSLHPILVLNGVLLPVNMFRLTEALMHLASRGREH
jgi:CRP/FNR family transcriptional regulator, cyclic AMP receptor protein